jgi:hypothetical protein
MPIDETALAPLRALQDACRLAEDYIVHASNWPMGTRIAKRKAVLNALRSDAVVAALAARPPDVDDVDITVGGVPWTDEQLAGMRAIALRADLRNAAELLRTNGYSVVEAARPHPADVEKK